ncbi:MAG: thioredoxin-disulfide reductase [Patescibacteria group bacterium]
MREVIIIGSGPAGYTAAIYAARAGLYPLVFAGELAGGQLTLTTKVENFPGFPEGIDGPELMEAMRRQAERFGAKIVSSKVTAVDLAARPFRVTADGAVEEARSLIIATGGTARRLGLPSEERLYGRGVSTCATCDAFFYRGKQVAVVGGGDSAMEEADFISRFADRVTLIVRRDVLRASKAMQERVLANQKIAIVWNTVVEEILGAENDKVTGVRLKNVKTGEASELVIDGFFPIIGHDPNSELFRGQLELDAAGYIRMSDGTTATSVQGVFVCGDVADSRYRQAVTAAGSGCRAALDALHFLEQTNQ